MMSRILCVSFLGLMMFQKISGELLYEDIIEARDMEFGSLEDGIMKINPQGPLNLLLGFLAHKLGLDYNMRMYSPEIEPKFKNDKGEYERCWREDEGVGELGKVLIDLFPSHGGSLSVSSSGDTSFSTSLTKGGKDRDKGVRFLAALMVYSLGGGLEYKKNVSNKNSFVSIGGIKIEKLKREAALRIIKIIEYVSQPDSTTDMDIIERFVKSKRFLLLSFLFMFLDNNIEMREFLNTFFSLADEGVVKKCFVGSDYRDEINYKLLGNVVNKTSLFPFSELNPPPSNMAVNGYSRNKDGGRGGFLNATFTDCAEISLLEFVCCIFYNPEASSYPIDKLEKTSPDLVEFFSSRKSLFAFDMECRREWFKVVQDRRDGEGKHDTRINYVRKYSETGSSGEPDEKCSSEEDARARNEVEPGFLNLLSLLKSIWNIDDGYLPECKLLGKRSRENEPKEGNKIDMTIEEFKDVFEKMICIINSGEKSIDVEYNGLRIGVEEGFWDIYGDIILTIEIEGVFEAEIKLEHSESHAEMTIIKTEVPGMLSLEKSSKAAWNLLSSNNELLYLIGKYVTGCISPADRDSVLELVQENIYNGFSHGCLNNDYLRVGVVDGLHNLVEGLEESSDVYRSAHEIMRNIIANSTLSDYAVRYEYGKFFFMDESFFERFFRFVKFDEEKTLYFLGAVGSNIGKRATYDYLKKNYGSIFMKMYSSQQLVEAIIHNNRSDLFKIVSEIQGCEYPGLSIAKIHGFRYSLNDSTEDKHFYYFAEGLFDMISKEEIIRNRPEGDSNKSGLEGFLQILKRSGDISKERQEKLFCYYFYTQNNGFSQSIALYLEVLMEQTCNSANFPIDFISDCIVRRPDVYFCEVYIRLLESILKRGVSENSRIKLGEDGFGMISHVVEFINDDENQHWVSSMRPSAEKLRKLLDELKEEGLIRPVCFNKDKLMEVATRYLRSIKVYETFRRYVSSVNEIMKEGGNEGDSILCQ